MILHKSSVAVNAYTVQRKNLLKAFSETIILRASDALVSRLCVCVCVCVIIDHSSSYGVCGVSSDVPSSPEGAVGIRLSSTKPHQCHSHPDCCEYPLPVAE